MKIRRSLKILLLLGISLLALFVFNIKVEAADNIPEPEVDFGPFKNLPSEVTVDMSAGETINSKIDELKTLLIPNYGEIFINQIPIEQVIFEERCLSVKIILYN